MPHVIPITDFAAPELDIYARLTENQLLNRADPANALFVAESPLVIGRALDAGCVPVSFLMETKHITGKGAEIAGSRCPADIPVYAAELEVLTQLTGFHLTRGMLCAMRRPPLPAVEALCATVTADRRAGKRDEPHQYWCNFPLRRSAGNGRRAADRRRKRPAVPPGQPGQHGKRIPGAVGLSAGGHGLDGNPARNTASKPQPWLCGRIPSG